MKTIKGSDVKMEVRHKHGFDADTVLVLREADYKKEIDLYAFWFDDEQGQNAGLLWEDDLRPKTAAKLKKEGNDEQTR